MKKTIRKIGISAVFAAAILASSSFMSCQNSFDDMSEIETFSENLDARAAKTTDEKIDEMYNEMTKPEKWKYEGEKLATTRILGEVTSLLPIDEIENENLRKLATIGTKIAEAGTAALDKYLNNYTCGLYGLAVDIFWPEEEKPDPIAAKLNEVESQLKDMDKKIDDGIDQLKSAILQAPDKPFLRDRFKQLVEMRKYTDKPDITNFLRGSEDGKISFSDYQSILKSLTGKSIFSGSIPDILTAANTMYSLYTEQMVGDDSFYKICDRYARSTSAWGFEYDKIMKGFATSELVTSTRAFNILKTVYAPYLAEGHVNYNYEIMRLLDYVNNGGELYSNIMNMINGSILETDKRFEDFTFTYTKGETETETVTPKTISNTLADSAKLYEYLLAFLCKSKIAIFPEQYVDVVFNRMDIKELEGINECADSKMERLKTYMTSKQSGVESWQDHKALYEKYVKEVDKLYANLTNDGAGYVTCMIPGVERTFVKSMGFVEFGFRVFSHLGMRWTNQSSYINKIFHGQDILGDWNTKGEHFNKNVVKFFTKNIQEDVYKKDYDKLRKNTFSYMTEGEYEKIFKWYRDSNHPLHKSVPVTYTDSDGNVMRVEKNTGADVINNPSFNEIFYYGAGIGLKFDIKKSHGMVVLTPLADLPGTDDYLGIQAGDGSWDPSDGDKPTDWNNLFQIGANYAYEEGHPVAKKVSDRDSIFGDLLFGDDVWCYDDIVEFRIESYSLNGIRNASYWDNNRWHTNYLVTYIPSLRNKTTPEDVLFSSHQRYAKRGYSPTYIFPSVVHDMGWKTYWQNRNNQTN